ncbi:MAG: hypothetical protein ACI8TQ_001252 [Planctomycetota bacterium]|jgi:hypothetical protein
MQSKAKTVKQYLAELPEDRREAIQAVRKVVLKNLPKGYEEGMQYGMIGYFVPHSLFPAGYHCDPTQPLPFAALASQKNHMAIYLMCIYGSEKHKAWFSEAWLKTGKKLDMGKSCIRFKKLEQVALNVIGQAIKKVPASKFIAAYQESRNAGSKAAKQAKPVAKKKVAKKVTKKVAKKVTKKKATKRAKAK